MIPFWLESVWLSDEACIKRKETLVQLAKMDAEIRKTRLSKRKFWASLFESASEQGMQTFVMILCIVMTVSPAIGNSVLRWNGQPSVEATMAAGIHELGKTGFLIIFGKTWGKKSEDDESGTN